MRLLIDLTGQVFKSPAALILPLCGLLFAGCASPEQSVRGNLRERLTFYASFDHGPDADYARGDRRLYHGKSMNERFAGQPGLPEGNVIRIEENAGKFGHALHFTQAKSPVVYFRAPSNVDFKSNNWGGTVSFWLSTDPATRLAPGYCDPIQITSRAWNDAAFFVEFEKRSNSIPFRLGVYPDLKVWNPNNRDWNSLAPQEKPLLTVDQPPFGPGKWTHVAFTFDGFNTGQSNGIAKLYLDGQLRGTIPMRTQTFTWDPAKSLIMLGLSYVGLYDEVAIFDRPLSPEEILNVQALPDGIRSLLR